MSVTITAVPLSLLLIPLIPVFTNIAAGVSGVQMSRQRGSFLDEFAKDKLKVTLYAECNSVKEMVNIIESCGLQYTKLSDSSYRLKYHYNLSTVWTFHDDNRCTVEVSENSGSRISDVDVKGFMDFVSVKYGKDIFGLLDSKGKLPTYTYKTAFTDQDVLIKTLTEHGALNVEINGENVTCEIEDVIFEFVKGEDGGYIANASYNGTKEDLTGKMSELNDEYCQNVQEKTYETIKRKVEEENLQIESEEVLEDNSILLTINLD